VAAIDAVRAAVVRNEPFDIVVTDLGMPNMDGRQVAAAVRAASPATPVVMLTGWGHRLISDNDIPPHVSRVLSKPARLSELRAALADLTVEGPAGVARQIR
jgi:DNA-binding NarL/FixJ family response regulator